MELTKLEAVFENVNRGLSVLCWQHEIGEAAHSAANRRTFEQAVYDQRSSYARELERVVKEIKLTAEYTAAVAEDDHGPNGKQEPEEIIAYYSGVFLDQVHQAKDKLLRFVDLMAAQPPFPRAYDEPKEVSVGKARKKHGEMLKKTGIDPLLDEWSGLAKPIKVALDKRTEHHHRVSRLRYHDDYHRVTMSKLVLKPDASVQLSEHGKQYMADLGQKSFEAFKADMVERQASTISAIEESVSQIIEKLISEFDVPTDPKVIAEILGAYFDFMTRDEIKNETSKEKIPSELSTQVLEGYKEFVDKVRDRIRTVYLVGSVGRGDFVPGSSDINFVVITHGYTKVYDGEMPATMHFIDDAEFMSRKFFKQRFICWSDGLLLEGEPIKFDKRDFPKPGMLLSLLLNEDAREKLVELKTKAEAVDEKDGVNMRLLSLKVVRTIADYDFGIAMGNEPYYSASRMKKFEHMNAALGDNNYRTKVLQQIYDGARISKSDLVQLIDAGLETIDRTFPKLEACGDELNKLVK